MDRRTFVAAIGASALSAPLAHAQTRYDTDEATEAEIAATVQLEFRMFARQRLAALPRGSDGYGTGSRAGISRTRDYVIPALTPALEEILAVKYWRSPEGQRQFRPGWIDRSRHPDYSHLAEFGAPPQTFELSDAVLRLLAAGNAFQFRDRRQVRLIGLRGCALEDDGFESGWRATHRLKVVTPDHVETRCLIGLWRPADGRIALFRGSTVPQAANMYAVLRTDGKGASLLPTGLYRYRIGVHAGTPRTPQPGALKNDGNEKYVVLRSPRDLDFDAFDAEDMWTLGGAHNIHSAGVGARNPKFDSSGCQVIQGYYPPPRTKAVGHWLSFQKAAGLAQDDGTPSGDEPAGQGTFDYMLLTGDEASLAANRAASFARDYRRLRPGSRGDRVRALQTRLFAAQPQVLGQTVRPDGDFGANTAFAALIARKLSDENEYTTPIVVG